MMKKIFVLIMTIATVISCGKSDDDNVIEANYTLKILKAEEVTLNVIAVHYEGKVETEEVKKLLKEDVVRTYRAKGAINISVSATGNDKSKLTLQLFKDDKLLKESTSNGTILLSSISN